MMRVSVLAWASLAATVSLVLAGPLAAPRSHQDEPSQITVTSLGGGQVKRIEFCPGDTVAQLKVKIAKLDGGGGGGPTGGDMRLVYAGKQLQDDRALSDYGIQSDSNIISLQRPAPPTINAQKLAPIKRLFVKTITGQTVSVPADGDLTVALFKRVIEMHLREVAADKQELIFNGIVLEDAKTLAECGLQDESSVSLTVRTATRFGAPDTRTEERVIEGTAEEVAEQLAQLLCIEGVCLGKMRFVHNEAFAELATVRQLLDTRVRSHVERTNPELAPVMLEVYKRDSMLFQFEYEHRGVVEKFEANLANGAQWVADQAQAAIEQEEAHERDVGPTRGA